MIQIALTKVVEVVAFLTLRVLVINLSVSYFLLEYLPDHSHVMALNVSDEIILCPLIIHEWTKLFLLYK